LQRLYFRHIFSHIVIDLDELKYTKRKTVHSNHVQFEQANEQSSVQVDPTNSMHLELDESLNNDNNDLTFDEFDRMINRNRVISSEDEIVVEITPKDYKNSLKGIYNIY
jgi:hypothetical protein